jgi:hypothetical protein
VTRWSALPWEEVAFKLRDLQTYEVKLDSKTYQIEVQLLENTEKYLHILVAVDDGSLPASLFPAARSFILTKILPTTPSRA